MFSCARQKELEKEARAWERARKKGDASWQRRCMKLQIFGIPMDRYAPPVAYPRREPSEGPKGEIRARVNIGFGVVRHVRNPDIEIRIEFRGMRMKIFRRNISPGLVCDETLGFSLIYVKKIRKCQQGYFLTIHLYFSLRQIF